jgi:hypothetical protein
MPLTPSDILKIQSAIDKYKKRYPRRPSPSAAEALAWRAGRHQRELRSDSSGWRNVTAGGAWPRALKSALVGWKLFVKAGLGTIFFIKKPMTTNY